MTINKEQLRAFIATPKGKLLTACALLALCWLILLLYFFGDTIAAFGDPQSLKKAQKELVRQKSEHEKIRARYDELQEQKKRYRAISGSAWGESREEQVKTKLHNNVTAAASKLEFKLSRISSVNIGRLNNELYYADIDIAADGNLDEIINLIAAMEDIRPAPTWKQLVLRPDNRPRPRLNSGMDSLNLANQNLNVERTRVMMSGTLRVICTDDPSRIEPERTPAK